ncbi:hypothetical protein PHSY_001081 [Pseudozyma hubeiensis SY62]|uniref:Uncharacterized protein n=1 Tax=Pseudozyma hubeiensis (strain SY62) TaxID=1305764 RepID=R9NY06_PSEHS|nr:hypothetical protein PHSY_001081 [Pseudozyma hubeiensis SY62]GAC93516.1 hypothetical protein PHSY_001081 [Pseudozyma hubeiensis SY62]
MNRFSAMDRCIRSTGRLCCSLLRDDEPCFRRSSNLSLDLAARLRDDSRIKTGTTPWHKSACVRRSSETETTRPGESTKSVSTMLSPRRAEEGVACFDRPHAASLDGKLAEGCGSSNPRNLTSSSTVLTHRKNCGLNGSILDL